MADKSSDGNAESKEQMKAVDDDPNIIRSPLYPLFAELEIPEVPFTDYLFKCLDVNYELLKDEDWMVDVGKGTSFKYRDIEPLSRKIASAFTRFGFKKGDILYFVTYDVALIYMVQIAVWRCGGAVRGCFQREDKEEFERQMRETDSRFILCDPETAEPVKWASERLGWPVTLLSIGRVEGTTDVEEMIEGEDGSAFPHDVKINPREDILHIPNTSGSTGRPKGVLHTHFNLVAFASNFGLKKIEAQRRMNKSAVALMATYAVGSLVNVVTTISLGFTIYNVSRFDPDIFMDQILKYKPDSILIFPYVLNWLISVAELENYDLSFLKRIGVSGAVFDYAAAKIIQKRLPSVVVSQVYASSEALCISTSVFDIKGINTATDERIAGLKFKRLGEEVHISSGPLLPLVETKVVDEANGYSVGRMVSGTIMVKSPYLMKGYLNKENKKGNTSEIIDGWLNTGDIGFFDENGHLYLLGSRNFTFKYSMHHVSPFELENVIKEHPSVLSVAVVGVPDPETTSSAWAYVVLKPGCTATKEDIKGFVAERKVSYKHLHGGVVFVDSLPENKGGKFDRSALIQMALKMKKFMADHSL